METYERTTPKDPVAMFGPLGRHPEFLSVLAKYKPVVGGFALPHREANWFQLFFGINENEGACIMGGLLQRYNFHAEELRPGSIQYTLEYDNALVTLHTLLADPVYEALPNRGKKVCGQQILSGMYFTFGKACGDLFLYIPCETDSGALEEAHKQVESATSKRWRTIKNVDQEV